MYKTKSESSGSKWIQVVYGQAPPIGTWHENGREVRIDYVPRGATWWLSTTVGLHVSTERSQLDRNSNSNPEYLGNLTHVPIDHRIILGIENKNEKYLKSASDFVEQIHRIGGDFWIMDTDKNGHTALYAISSPPNPSRYHKRPQVRPSSDQFPSVHWPDSWHLAATDDDVEPTFHPGPPFLKAPWCRLIVFEGLSRVARSPDFETFPGEVYNDTREDPKEHRARIPLFFNTDVDWLLEEHLAGTSGLASNTFQQGCCFQVSWFEIDIIHESDPGRNLSVTAGITESARKGLRLGRLYRGKPSEWLRQGAFTIYAVAEDQRDMILRKNYPTSLPGAKSHFDEQQSYHDTISKMQVTMVRLATIGLLRVWHGFGSVKDHIGFLLENFSDIFDPEKHDGLLTDGDLYSNARIISWIISTIYEVERVLERNMKGWEDYHELFIKPLDLSTWAENERGDFEEKVHRCNEMAGKLNEIRAEFKEQERRILTLREGLFSLASIAEAKAGTSLGENVELLTYISVFFLPLAFVTSLWSVEDVFSKKALAPTIVLVAISTYFLVFNLRGLTYRLGEKYSSWKSDILCKMRNDRCQKWREQAERFQTVQSKSPKRASNWSLFLYWALTVVKCRSSQEASSV